MNDETRKPLPAGEAVSNEQDAPFWTPKRVIYILIILITLIAFLAYVLSPTITGVFAPPPPEPINGPLQRA